MYINSGTTVNRNFLLFDFAKKRNARRINHSPKPNFHGSATVYGCGCTKSPVILPTEKSANEVKIKCGNSKKNSRTDLTVSPVRITVNNAIKTCTIDLPDTSELKRLAKNQEKKKSGTSVTLLCTNTFFPEAIENTAKTDKTISVK
jgi:hypothetical protein